MVRIVGLPIGEGEASACSGSPLAVHMQRQACARSGLGVQNPQPCPCGIMYFNLLEY